MAECTCRDDCCLEIVPVTINNYTIDAAAVELTVTAVSATEANVDIQVDEADYFEVRCWFQDNPLVPAANPTLVPPPTPGVAELNVVTDATGLAVLNVQNAGAAQTWYLCATIGNGVVISDLITLGV